MFAGLHHPSAAASAAGYYPDLAIVTLAALVFSLYMTSAANAQAEQQLRRDIAERLRAERELAESRQASIYSAKMAALGEMSGTSATRSTTRWPPSCCARSGCNGWRPRTS